MIYFIQQGEDGPVKIGHSVDPESRLQCLQIGSPHPLSLLLTLPGGRSEEKSLHSRFANCRLDGEWFSPAANLMEFISSPLSILNIEGEDNNPACQASGKYAFGKYKLLYDQERANQDIEIFHRVRRRWHEKVWFWLRHHRYFAWQQVIDKEIFIDSQPGLYIEFDKLIGVNMDKDGVRKWRGFSAFCFETLYIDDIWQYFPWLFDVKDAREMLNILSDATCTCGGTLRNHDTGCVSLEWQGLAINGFIRFFNGPAWLNIWLDWTEQEILDNPEIAMKSRWFNEW